MYVLEIIEVVVFIINFQLLIQLSLLIIELMKFLINQILYWLFIDTIYIDKGIIRISKMLNGEVILGLVLVTISWYKMI